MHADKAIKNRKTEKVLANKPLPIGPEQETFQNTIHELLKLASFAPYHKKCADIHTNNKKLNSCIPWRTYILDTTNCRLLYDYIALHNIKAGKISNMLAAADGLLLVTWLPEPTEENQDSLFQGNLKNMEHIAATSAAIQNILIGATARNIPNYWSSGGQLTSTEFKEQLGIPKIEILLGAIFLFPKDTNTQGITIKNGALRDQGKEQNTWSKWVEL